LKSTFNGWYEKKMRKTPDLANETDRIESFLPNISTIAIVGISRNRHRDSQYVGRYLQNAGYKIIPVNPSADKILGEKAYPDLESIPFSVDVVNIFRSPDDISQAVDEALAISPKVIWLQLGTGKHPEQKTRVLKTGIEFVQNRCIKVDHQFLIRPKSETDSGQESALTCEISW
jgi:uncharacterized protein